MYVYVNFFFANCPFNRSSRLVKAVNCTIKRRERGFYDKILLALVDVNIFTNFHLNQSNTLDTSVNCTMRALNRRNQFYNEFEETFAEVGQLIAGK